MNFCTHRLRHGVCAVIVLGWMFSLGGCSADSDPASQGSASKAPANSVGDGEKTSASDPAPTNTGDPPAATGKVATFGSGCFWCTEAVMERLAGVESAVSGYMGGTTVDPSYREVCSGETGHAEVVQVTYDPSKVTYEQLLEVFWKTHDPTTLNQQGADHGTQYRSVVFYHNESQRRSAEHYLKKLDESGAFGDPIVTEVTEASEFYVAEKDHQDYYARFPYAGYCQMVIVPKMEKFKKAFASQLKTD